MNKVIRVLSVTGILAAALILYPAQARAARGGHDPHRGYPHARSYPYGSFSINIPHGAIRIGFGKENYYYHGGAFYRPFRHEYRVVTPPAGIVVYQIPVQFNEVVVDGVMYYTYNGVYYKRVAPQGYQVVQPPAAVVVEPAMISTNSAPDEETTFTVNIPLSKGGYKAVIIKRDGEGFQGPQGEFYFEFPKVQQLKVMYGDAPRA